VTSVPRIWWSLCGWRWWRNAGAEVARRVAPVASADDAESVRLLSRYLLRIERTARWVPGSRCLDRALALIECAAAEGVTAQLCVGVRRVDQQLRAHAWVQAGEIIIDPDPQAVSRFVRLQAHQPGLEFDR
jgi:hypothetical protein